MIDTLKKTILAGVGAAVVTREKIQGALDELVAQGKVSAEDARSMADKIAKDGKKEFEEASTKLSKQLQQLLSKTDQVTHDRITALEARLKAMETKASKPKPAKKAKASSSEKQ